MTNSGKISLNGIRSYIFSCSDDLNSANKITHDIVLYVNGLADRPFIGRIVENEIVKGKNIRRVTFNKKYNIYYQVDEQVQIVYILKIANGKQSIE